MSHKSPKDPVAGDYSSSIACRIRRIALLASARTDHQPGTIASSVRASRSSSGRGRGSRWPPNDAEPGHDQPDGDRRRGGADGDEQRTSRCEHRRDGNQRASPDQGRCRESSTAMPMGKTLLRPDFGQPSAHPTSVDEREGGLEVVGEGVFGGE